MHKTVLLIAALVGLFLLVKTMKESYTGYKKFGSTTFQGGDIDMSEVEKEGECADKCTDLDTCKAFTVTRKPMNGKLKCWTKKDEVIRGANRSRDASKSTFIKSEHFDFWKDDLSASSKDEKNQGCVGQVTLYEHVDFEGRSISLPCGGPHQVSTGAYSTGYSSIKIPKMLKAMVANADGEWSGWWKGDQEDVGEGWNDKIVQVKVAAK